MIHEYALDPAVLLSWAGNDRDYAEFFREYGLGTARIISSFPKKKVSKLRSYLLQRSPQDNESLQAQRYMEMVTKLVESIVLRDVPDNQAQNWSDAAKIENERIQFGAVLSAAPIATGKNITPANMYNQNSIWNHPDQIDIQRTKDGFMAAVSNLIRLSTKQIVIIDAFGWKYNAIQLIQCIANAISSNRVHNQFPSICLFYKEKLGSRNSSRVSPSPEQVKTKIFQGLNTDVSKIQLKIAELREIPGNDVFHNRCILTEHGGVSIGHGIDVSGDYTHSDEAFLFAGPLYQKKWHQFVEAPCFEIVSEA
jgi:hypothetical protein